MHTKPSSEELYAFIKRASKATYAGNGETVEPEREGFIELIHTEGNFSYRDSFTGHTKSRGMEIVRYMNTPIWTSLYGGGMVTGKEGKADITFTFLKKAMIQEEKGFVSFRGPKNFVENDWSYVYTQEGDIDEFWGYEEISYKADLYFYHRIIGGKVQN